MSNEMLVSARSGVGWGAPIRLCGRVCIRPAGRMLARIALRAILVSRAMAEALRAFADIVVGRRRLKA